MIPRWAATADATFLPDIRARRGRFALWGDGAEPTDTIALLRPDDDGVVALRETPVQFVSMRDAIDPLAGLRAATEASTSVRAWAAATAIALDLIARGRILPTISGDGRDAWAIGPIDAGDRTRVIALAEAMPPAAHATPVDDDHPDRMTDPFTAVNAYLRAVADTLVRTAGAEADAGHKAFGTVGGSAKIATYRDWLEGTTASVSGSAAPRLRVDLGGKGDKVSCVLELQSLVDAGLVLPAADLWVAPPTVFARFGSSVDTDLLVTLRKAARVWPPISRFLDQARPDRIGLDADEAEELFGPLVDDLAAAGLPVLWPAETLRTVDLRPVVTTLRPESLTKAGMDLSTLGELRWRATVDGGELTDDELQTLANAKRSLVRLRGQWVRADPTKLRRLRDHKPATSGEVLAAALTGELVVDGEAVEAEIEAPLLDIGERLRAFDPTTALGPPTGLDATLRHYQERGLAWLAEMAQLGLGGVLADDMGLGKTIQVLALHLHRRGSGPMLVVCPASVLGNWEREAHRFSPDVPVLRYHGPKRELGVVADDEIVICTYGVVRRDAALLSEVPWGLVVADEAQAIKNPMSRTARAMRTFPSGIRFALTGTPVENRLSDLWALLDWTTPGLLGKLDDFQQHVAVPIERDQDPEATERLASVVRPFLLRRRKIDPDIAPDLPPKTETDQFVGLTSEQATLYKAVVDELMEAVEKADGMDRRGLVLKMLTALKQVCNHPAQYVEGSAASGLGGRSGKLDAAMEIIQTIVDEGDSVLLFSQYVAMGHLLGQRLNELNISNQFLHGSVPVNKRQTMVDAFQDGDPKVFVISLQAGGTGLNLTQATHVIHYDRWWNPAVEDQASDRAWRIGQDRPVQVHRMICEGTLEEKIAAILETKRNLADKVVGGGEAWVSELSDAELASLVSLGGY